MSDWAFLNKHRVELYNLKPDPSHGWNGAFEFSVGTYPVRVICSDGQHGGEGWKHVSVTIRGSRKPPPWEVMCAVKELFWEPEETVMQLHPPKSTWINNHPGCLHLWQPKEKIPLPPSILVGAQSIGLLPEKPTPEAIIKINEAWRVAREKEIQRALQNAQAGIRQT